VSIHVTNHHWCGSIAEPTVSLMKSSNPLRVDASALAPLTIDLRAHPDLRFRIDAFSVPSASRAEFEGLMRRNLKFLETLPGFMSHMVFEKTDGPTAFNIVTVAVWESPDAIAGASARVQAFYRSIGFEMPAVLGRLGVTASFGYYHAPINLQ